MTQKTKGSEVFFVRALGQRRKKRVTNARQITEQTESDFIRTAIDEKLDRLAKKFPKINKV